MRHVLLAAPFSATHQILIAGDLEPVHGHDFEASAVLEIDDERDASMLLSALQRAVAELEATPLDAVARHEGGLPSAERIARYLYGRLAEGLRGENARVQALSVRESPGCVATYHETDR